MFEGSRRAWTHHWGKGIPRLLSEETGTLSRGLRIIHEGFKCVLIVGPWLVVLEWPFSWSQSAAPFEWTKHEVNQQEMKYSYAYLCN